MESIYAALLLHKAGKKITEDAVDKVLKAAGAKVDSSDITKLIAGLKGADIDEIISSAASVPVLAASVSSTPAVAEVKEDDDDFLPVDNAKSTPQLLKGIWEQISQAGSMEKGVSLFVI